jgi:hypothetical protein
MLQPAVTLAQTLEAPGQATGVKWFALHNYACCGCSCWCAEGTSVLTRSMLGTATSGMLDLAAGRALRHQSPLMHTPLPDVYDCCQQQGLTAQPSAAVCCSPQTQRVRTVWSTHHCCRFQGSVRAGSRKALELAIMQDTCCVN